MSGCGVSSGVSLVMSVCWVQFKYAGSFCGVGGERGVEKLVECCALGCVLRFLCWCFVRRAFVCVYVGVLWVC